MHDERTLTSPVRGQRTVAGSPYAITPVQPLEQVLGNYRITYTNGILLHVKGTGRSRHNQTKTYGTAFTLRQEFTTTGLVTGDAVTSVTLTIGCSGQCHGSGSPYAITTERSRGHRSCN